MGITISIKDGKRVLLGDLFEKDRLLDWFYAMGKYDENESMVSGVELDSWGTVNLFYGNSAVSSETTASHLGKLLRNMSVC